MQVTWKPTIVAFCCNWCSYAGADLSGTNRLQYPANVKIIRIPCSCRLNPMFILRAFQKGADGVILCGCHPGDCHYTTGNYYARRRMTLLFSMLDFLGIEKGRTRVEWVSAAEGAKYGFSIPSPDIRMRIALACDIVRKAKDDQQALHDLYAMFGGGDLSADSIPSAIALFLLGKGDVKKTLEYCVNFGGDCDTNGAMAGAMVGAMAGIDAVPQVWRDKISEMNACNFAKDADEFWR